MSIIFVGGGSRSGKSSLALKLAHAVGSRRAFIATAQPFDDEMGDRISRHRAERDASFEIFEEPIEIARVLSNSAGRFDSVVVDCLTLWLSNLMYAPAEDIAARISELLNAAASAQARVILVSNEVGCGIVPDNADARRFRDLAGHLHQRVVERADEAYWTVFGVPLRLK